MKVHLTHRQDSLNSMPITILTHVKCLNDDGRFLAFARISPALLEFIRNLELDVPENLLNWKGKSCLNNPNQTT